LEPQRRVFWIKIEPLLTIGKSFLNAAFSFLVSARLKVYWAVAHCITNFSEHLSGFLDLAYPSLELGSLNLDTPLVTLEKLSDFFVFTLALHHFDAFYDQVFIFLAEIKTLAKKTLALLSVARFFA
jgi:hypothetical protein